MSWITDNKFMVALGGGTLAGAALLYFAGARGQGRYDQAKADFEAAKTDAAGYETGSLYPTQENRDGKQKALAEYHKATETLQAAFESFRPKELKDISPQEFTNRLKAADEQVRNAFADSRTKVPEPFFCGFEKYKTVLAGKTTGILDFQLTAIRNLMLALAKSGATELKNLQRPLLAEEEGKSYTPMETDVARPLPLEITFQGPEKSVREFLSTIVKPQGQYVVIRSLRVGNSKKDPPRSSDAKFDKPAASKRASAAEVFGGAFVLPGDDAKPEGDKKPAEAAAPVADSSRILSQVLGDEELQVFVRLDILQFLPAKPLPKTQ